MRVEPEPRNWSMTISPRLVRSRSASSSIAVGLTVGWSLSPRRGIGAERRSARIGPDVRAPTTAFAQFDIVDVRAAPFREQGQKFMLRAIEAAHAGVGLRPDDEVQRNEAQFSRSRMHGRQAAPVDERTEDPAVAKIG